MTNTNTLLEHALRANIEALEVQESFYEMHLDKWEKILRAGSKSFNMINQCYDDSVVIIELPKVTDEAIKQYLIEFALSMREYYSNQLLKLLKSLEPLRNQLTQLIDAKGKGDISNESGNAGVRPDTEAATPSAV